MSKLISQDRDKDNDNDKNNDKDKDNDWSMICKWAKGFKDKSTDKDTKTMRGQ